MFLKFLNMKKQMCIFRVVLIITLTNLLISSSVMAQVPQKMTYQAVIRDTADQLAVMQNIGMRISVLQGSPSGTAVYVETHTVFTNQNGLVTLQIGAGTPISGVFSAIDWTSGLYYLKTETDVTGGTNYDVVSTTQMLSVPYALYAAASEAPFAVGTGLSLAGNTINALTTSPLWNANALQGISVSNISPVTNDYLRYNGAAWVPSALPGGSGSTINCGTSFNTNYTVRGTGSSGWECTNALVITSSGYVGIGTTSPSSSYNLTVGTNGFLVNGSTTTSNIYGRLRIGSTSSTSYELQVDGHAYITSGLRVGTSSSPPSNGILASGEIRTNANFYQGSSSTGTGTVMVRTSGGELRPQSSTIKVKENIQPLSFNKADLFALRPVTYNLKPALGGGSEVGLIAEEVEKTMPQLVIYGPARQWEGETGLIATDENGNEILIPGQEEPYSVSYDRLAIYLLEIVKEQEQRISELERMVEEMRNQ